MSLHLEKDEDISPIEEDLFIPIYNCPSSSKQQINCLSDSLLKNMTEVNQNSEYSTPDTVIYHQETPNISNESFFQFKEYPPKSLVCFPCFIDELVSKSIITKTAIFSSKIAETYLYLHSTCVTRPDLFPTNCTTCKKYPFPRVSLCYPYSCDILLGNSTMSKECFWMEIQAILTALCVNLRICESELIQGIALFRRVCNSHYLCSKKFVDRLWIETVLIICIILGYKGNSDKVISNGIILSMFSMKRDELIAIERIVLEYLCWNVIVSREEYLELQQRLEIEQQNIADFRGSLNKNANSPKKARRARRPRDISYGEKSPCYQLNTSSCPISAISSIALSLPLSTNV